MTRKVKEGKADQRVRQKALELTRYLRSKDGLGEVHSLFEYVRDQIRYVLDINGIETVHDAGQTMEQGQGDCDDKAVLLASMLETIGHPTRFMAVGFKPGDLSHVIVQTPLGRRNGSLNWVYLDATEPHRMGWRPEGIQERMVQYN